MEIIRFCTCLGLKSSFMVEQNLNEACSIIDMVDTLFGSVATPNISSCDL